MFLPSQGLRHAATLLLTKGCRNIPAGATSDSVATALTTLASELAALADDMRAAPECADWLLAEYARVIDQLPHAFDRAGVQATAAAILSRVAARRPIVESRDVFLVYVPEDRLPVAAPLGIELVKRRVSVALDYEVVTSEQLWAALEHGLEHHRAGVVLKTRAFEGMETPLAVRISDRLRVIEDCDPVASAEELANWIRRLHATKAPGG